MPAAFIGYQRKAAGICLLESFTEKKEQRWLLISAKNSVAAYSF